MASITLYTAHNFNADLPPGKTAYSHTWDHNDYTLLNDDLPGVGTGNWNDQASSFKITSGHWVLYEDVNFGGAHTQVLGPGDYNLNQFEALGIHNDKISSLQLWSV
jgi:Beta/Gamma crystallin